MKKISIVTPWAGSTASLLADYDRATVGAELVLVDNASDAETRAALETLPGDRGVLLRNETNLGFAGGNNQGYAKATGDIIIFLNSDIAAADGTWLKQVADDVKDGALYGPSLQYQLVAGRHLPYLEGWCVAATRKTWDRLVEAMWDVVEERDGAFQPIGPWDQFNFRGPYWEDNDLCLRALQSGISLVQTAWLINHKGGQTAGSVLRHAQSFAANERTFTERVLATEVPAATTPTWSAYLQACATNSDIQHYLPLLYSVARGNVVELGTRGGMSTTALLAGVEAHGGTVWSVDIDERSRGVADGNPLWTFTQADSRDAKFAEYVKGQAGEIDVLLIDTYHTRTQAKAELDVWHRYVKPGGTILMHDPESFPGVRRAAQEFADSKQWPITFILPCNGMAVIERPK